MTVYKDVELVNKIIKNVPNDWDVYVHVDEKSSIVESQLDNKVYVIKKYKINWGSINHLLAIIELLKIAFEKTREEAYFHIITGQDYFVTSPEGFDKIVNGGKIFLDIVSNPKWYNGGEDIWKYRTLAQYIDLRKPFNRKINRLYMFLQKYMGLCKSLPSYPIYGGSVYCSLPTNAVEYVLNSDIAKKMLNALKSSAIGEEIFFQTVLMNSPLKSSIIISNLRYSDWSVVNSPKTLNEEDFKSISASNALFCRKVDLIKSNKLLEMLPIQDCIK